MDWRVEGEEGKGVSRGGGSIYLPTLCSEMITGGCYVHVPMYMCMYVCTGQMLASR